MRTILLIFLLAVGFMSASETNAAFTSPAPLSGYAWSSNIGWINFNGPGYGVRINTDFTITGHAWNSTGLVSGGNTGLGWLQFGGLTGCPGGGNCNARIDTSVTPNELRGWARFTSNGGGWSGWVSLNCANTGTCGTSDYKVIANNGVLQGYAWGGGGSNASSSVVGWISFSGSPGYSVVSYTRPCTVADATCTSDLSGRNIPDQWCSSFTTVPCVSGSACSTVTNSCEALPITALLTVSPAAIRRGDTATVTWSTTNASACTLEQNLPGQTVQTWSGMSGTESSAPITGLTLFSLSCTDALGVVTSEVASTSVRIIPNLIET